MPDQPSNPAPAPPTAPGAPADATPPSPQRGPTIKIGDEFGTAKRNLPPLKPLLLTTGVILIIVAIVSFFERAQPQGSGSLESVTAAELPGQNASLVALTFTLHISGQKFVWVHDIQGKLSTSRA